MNEYFVKSLEAFKSYGYNDFNIESIRKLVKKLDGYTGEVFP